MLPVIAAKNIAKAGAKKVGQGYKNSSQTVKKVVWGIFGAIVVFFTGRFIVKRIKRNQALKRLANSPEVQQAALIRGALNPSGASWLMWTDGTLENKLFSVASQITDINKVAKAYNSLYGSNMLIDIQNELQSGEYTRFLNAINKKSDYTNNKVGVTDTEKSKIVVANSNSVDFYASKTTFKLPFQSIKTLELGQYPVGLTTGKVYQLSLFGSSYTTQYFAVEVRVKTKEGNYKNIYVSQAEVKLVANDKESRKPYKPIRFYDADFK